MSQLQNRQNVATSKVLQPQNENVHICYAICCSVTPKGRWESVSQVESSDIWWSESELHLADDSGLVSPALGVI